MKKTICCLFILTIMLLSYNPLYHSFCHAETTSPMIAIVIDDFGEDRGGVVEMLNLNIPLTCAVMPNMTYSEEDAKLATSLGHEVILHMPLECPNYMPPSWYGSTRINRRDSAEIAVNKIKEALKSVPYAKGINFHMGPVLNDNAKTISKIVEYAKENNLYFLDSKTNMNSSCKEVCHNANACFLERDLFLELHGAKSMQYAINQLKEAVNISKQKGYSIVIGHVGPEGGLSTVNAIKQCLNMFEKEGVKVVPMSEIYQNVKNLQSL